METKKKKELRMISLTLACWGLLFIGSGAVLNTKETTVVKYNYSVTVSQNKVAESKTNEIKLKDMKLEVNTPLSVDIKDYLEDVENIDSSVLASLKLDTSKVNPQEAGTYTYTITYKRKTYNGTFTITAKQLPKVTITLKNLKIKTGTILSNTDKAFYIVETLTDEILNNIQVEGINEVNTNKTGLYQYKVIYNNQVYTANIEVYEDQSTSNAEEENTNNSSNENNNNNNENNNSSTTTDTTTNP